VVWSHASLRSVWFVNSLRGALALAAAVAIADLSNVQHGFWVVLGTLSVLRTNASSTGSTAARALAGTAIGFAVGAGLILLIGTDTAALWITLPIAVFVAAYAPGTAPFVVGQAAFTVVVSVLYNLLVPVGWTVGVVRIEDVAIGCLVSVVIGTLLWPRGVAGVVGDDLADAFRVGASYLTQAVEWALGMRAREPDRAPDATTAAIRLDDALRGFLAERGAKHVERRELWRLVGGSLRLRLTAQAVAALPHGVADFEQARDALAERARLIAAWCEQLAVCVGPPRGAASRTPDAGAFVGVDGAGRPGRSRLASYAILVEEHLDHLSEHLALLADPVVHVAEVRRRSWWR
jgi:uncharacterized membrane protein YccC